MKSVAWALVAVLISGCAAVVVPDDSDTEADTDPAPDVGPVCTIEPTAVMELRGVTSATLFGDVLHLEGVLDGEPTYAILRLGEGGAELLGARDDLAGGARWVEVGGSVHARLREGALLDVLDAADPTRPELVVVEKLGATVPEGFARTLGVADNEVFLCLQATDGAEGQVYAVDLSNARAPSVPEARFERACNGTSESRGTAQGALWVTWGTTDPGWNTDGVRLSSLSAASIDYVSDHGFAVSGVHHYGYVREVETDGAVAVATLENENYVFLYYADGYDHIVYSSFGGGDKKLLSVVDGIAYVVRGGDPGAEVVGYDVRNVLPEEDSPRTPMSVTLVSSDAADDFREVAHDAERLILADRAGQLFVVPLGAAERIEPLTVVEEGGLEHCP